MRDDKQSEYDIALETTPAPEPVKSLEEKLLDAMVECGCTIPNPSMAIAVMQPILDKIGKERAVHELFLMISRLNGKKGEEIKIALLGTMDKSLDDWAKELGIAKPTLFINVQRIKRRIFKKTSNSSAISE